MCIRICQKTNGPRNYSPNILREIWNREWLIWDKYYVYLVIALYLQFIFFSRELFVLLFILSSLLSSFLCFFQFVDSVTLCDSRQRVAVCFHSFLLVPLLLLLLYVYTKEIHNNTIYRGIWQKTHLLDNKWLIAGRRCSGSRWRNSAEFSR
jgi:hypothetical protein